MSKIVVFDSGVGGLSIYREIQKQLPLADIVFVSDNKAYPYGTKSEQALIKRVLYISERVIEYTRADLLVVACNSASTVVLPYLRERLSIPVVGVVPAIKPAAQKSKNKEIGLLATPATISRGYTQQLMREFASDCDVHLLGSSELVDLAEQKLTTGEFDVTHLATCLEPLLAYEKMDVLVLACTHFPLISKEIADFFKVKGQSLILLDSGLAVARRVLSLVEPQTKEKKASPQINQALFTKKFQASQYFINTLRELSLSAPIWFDN